MPRKLLFSDVCDYMRERDSSIIDVVDGAVGVLMIIIPPLVTSGVSAAIGALGLLAAKDHFTKLFKKVFESVSEGDYKNETPIERFERLNTAYCLICYTSFFEVIDDFFKAIDSKGLDIKKLLGSAAAEYERQVLDNSKRVAHDPSGSATTNPRGIAISSTAIPNPALSEKEEMQAVRIIHVELAKGFKVFIESYVMPSIVNENEKKHIKDAMTSLTEAAQHKFKSHHFSLCERFPEFFIWSTISRTRIMEANIAKIDSSLKAQLRAIQDLRAGLDIGFGKIGSILKGYELESRSGRAHRTIDELRTLYASQINQQIVKDAVIGADSPFPLTLPNKKDIYIPQAYRAICFEGKQVKLESDLTWSKCEVKSDLAEFIVGYLSSPHSIHSPLIIIGHPGSGKSLLANMIVAQLVSHSYSPIRVELRHINADSLISMQIQNQIKKDAAATDLTWADIQPVFKERPSVVVFDGYDELLQASGEVHSAYLGKIKDFQQTEVDSGRCPVRAIVTSRITLIDKASIPVGSTILRLEEFDRKRRDAWISIWNRQNTNFYNSRNVPCFEVSPNDEKITTLAAQPLLLLMLALYDSSLAESKSDLSREHRNLDQTVLYDRLLRSFVEREKKKDEGFLNLDQEMQGDEIENEMERLRIAALGMFNRRSLGISVGDLNQDIKYFRCERSVPHATAKRQLTQADLLFGSFFFIYESLETHDDAGDKSTSIDRVFEFLHNTFGEFLACDFMLRRIISQCSKIIECQRNKKLASSLHIEINEIGYPTIEWFSCLIYAPLFSRTVILDMMREWVGHLLVSEGISKDDFVKSLDMLLLSQINCILNASSFPSIMTNKDNAFPRFPIIGHCAIYTLNMVLVRAVIASEFIFDGSRICSYDDGAHPWDRMMFLWRSWFSVESLNGVSAIISTQRTSKSVMVKVRPVFRADNSATNIELFYNSASAIGDTVLAALSALVTERDVEEIRALEGMIADNGYDLSIEFLRKKTSLLRYAHSREKEDDIGYGIDEICKGLVDILQSKSRVVSRQSLSMLRNDVMELAVSSRSTNLARILLDLDLYHVDGRISPSALEHMRLVALSALADDPRFMEFAIRERGYLGIDPKHIMSFSKGREYKVGGKNIDILNASLYIMFMIYSGAYDDERIQLVVRRIFDQYDMSRVSLRELGILPAHAIMLLGGRSSSNDQDGYGASLKNSMRMFMERMRKY